MTLWLYTEDAEPLRDGPFYSELEAMMSDLWEWVGVCVWIEARGPRGWEYENVKWTGELWVVTSAGVRPADLVRPEFLLEAKPLQHLAEIRHG